jgi:hypothetical protein
MDWYEEDQEAQQLGEVLPMPRSLTNEEEEAEERREGLFPETQGDEWMFWWQR